MKFNEAPLFSRTQMPLYTEKLTLRGNYFIYLTKNTFIQNYYATKIIYIKKGYK